MVKYALSDVGVVNHDVSVGVCADDDAASSKCNGACGCTDVLAPNYAQGKTLDNGECSYGDSHTCSGSAQACGCWSDYTCPVVVPAACQDGVCSPSDYKAMTKETATSGNKVLWRFAKSESMTDAGKGAAISHEGGDDAKVSVTLSTFSTCKAVQGGAIYFKNKGELSVFFSAFTENDAELGGARLPPILHIKHYIIRTLCYTALHTSSNANTLQIFRIM